jgi:hypothetical protein
MSQYCYYWPQPLSELHLFNARNILETGSNPGCHHTKKQPLFSFNDMSKDKSQTT